MPLPKRAITPVCVSRVEVPSKTPSELEFVFNATLSNIIRQLHSLSRQAADLFEELSTEVTSICDRSANLGKRVDTLNQEMTKLNLGEEELLAGDLNYSVFQSRLIADQQVVNRRTIPKAILEMYEACDAPPPLSNFDQFRDDKKISMKFYTDPGFFFDQWSQELLQETKPRRANRKRKPKKQAVTKIRDINKVDYTHLAKGKEFEPDHYHDPKALEKVAAAKQTPSNDSRENSLQRSNHVRNDSASSGSGKLPPPNNQTPNQGYSNAQIQKPVDGVSSDNYVTPGYMPPTSNVGPYPGGMPDQMRNGGVMPPQPGAHIGGGADISLHQYNFDETSQYAALPQYGLHPDAAGITPDHELPPPPSDIYPPPMSPNNWDTNPALQNAVSPAPNNIPPPPPPPPPPPVSSDMKIEKPATTKPAQPPAQPQPTGMSANSGLLDAIRTGIQLRRVDQREEKAKPPVASGERNVQAIFEAALKRRQYLENNSDSEEDDDEGSQWDSDEK